MHRDDDLFADALELPHAERAAFLARQCADDAQRARIEALLASADAAGDFLGDSPVPRPALPAEEKPGDALGRYVLVRLLGEGGCGTVWLADQTEPVRRRVALKVIKLGMDTREVIARFEAERQALAVMDHPGIARVFDAGATAAGRPFFVMEYVDGLPITRFCDEHRLPTAQRLELFSQVCLALQHAHQKGVIHRDVKPSNILVALHDGVPTPKVIDFGIAKATGGSLAEHTLLTQRDQLIGTPAYMSPEQVEAREFDIDTRSDVYALGVLLYELLTGRPPYDPQSLVQAGLAEIRRIIREVDPPRPSTRLATLTAADRDTVARLRGAAAPQLSSVLRGDLDWIVMRCLEKDRARRYGTAHELADDIRRHLRREAVTARPPDALYRARKFVSRHRLACASAAAVAAALVAGTTISLLQAQRARRAETVARAERDAARAAQRAEAEARADAQRRQEQAEQLLTFMLGDFRTELKKIGKLNLLDVVGDKALAHFAALAPKDLSDTVLTSQAKALTQLGETRLDQARYADATAAFTAAHERSAALFDRHPQNADMLFERAQAEFWLGFTARRKGDFASARTWLTQYRDSALALVRLEPAAPRAERELLSSRYNLAVLLFDAGDYAAARADFLAIYALRLRLVQAQPAVNTLRERLAETASWLGRIAEVEGDYPEALRRYGELRDAMHELAAREPAVARWQYRRAEARGLSATVLGVTGQRDDAAGQWNQAIEELESLTAQDPANRQWLIALLNARLQRTRLHLAAGDVSAGEALPAIIRQLEQLAATEPDSRIIAGRLVTAWTLAAQHREVAHLPEAAAAAAAAVTRGEALIAGERADAWIYYDTTLALLAAGRIAAAEGRAAEARRHWERAVSLLTPKLAGTRDWRILDPFARAALLLADTENARRTLDMLKQTGYRAVDPLSAPANQPPP